MKYIPVLRHRTEERAALAAVKLSNKILPLIEIVKDKPRANSKGSFGVSYTDDLTRLGRPVIVDFPSYLPIRSGTKQEVANFLGPLQSNPIGRVQKLLELQGVPGLIPTVTHVPGNQRTIGAMTATAQAFREGGFKRIAFRLFYRDFDAAFQECLASVRPEDILLYDIDGDNHNSPALKKHYDILKAARPCRTALVRSAIDRDVTNLSLTDDMPIPAVDNSLLTDYTSYGFNAFGDYVGIKKDLLQKGGTISPGFIFYAWPDNVFIGYRGRVRDLDEFANHIAPTVLGSKYFKGLTPNHRQNCPGCLAIQQIARGLESGKSQAKWKRISLMHYLYSMEENL